MKRIINYLFITLFTIAIFSCGDSYFEESTEYSSATEINKTDKERNAVLQAVELAKSFGFATRSAVSEDIVSSVYTWTKEKFTLNKKNELGNDTLMYIVNFRNDNGFVLFSANTQEPKLLAYVEHGSLTPDSPIENNGFLLFLKKAANMRWEPDTIQPSQPSIENLPWTTDTIYGPLITTKWSQRSPFNGYCPQINGQQCPAGCVAVATGQIAAYHEHPTSYNGRYFDWASIKEDTIPLITTDILSVAGLMIDIGRIVNMNYTPDGSLAQRDSIVYSLDSLGYHHSNLMNYDFQTCVQELKDNRPVYIIGKGVDDNNENCGHAWLIDGCLIRSVHTYLYPHATEYWRTHIQRLVHCNWGFQGNYDGYFLSNVLNTEQPISITRLSINSNIVIFKEVYPND